MSDIARVQKATGLRLFWYTMWARAYPRMIGAAREKIGCSLKRCFP